MSASYHEVRHNEEEKRHGGGADGDTDPAHKGLLGLLEADDLLPHAEVLGLLLHRGSSHHEQREKGWQNQRNSGGHDHALRDEGVHWAQSHSVEHTAAVRPHSQHHKKLSQSLEGVLRIGQHVIKELTSS
jgi:hypothetical protein